MMYALLKKKGPPCIYDIKLETYCQKTQFPQVLKITILYYDVKYSKYCLFLK